MSGRRRGWKDVAQGHHYLQRLHLAQDLAKGSSSLYADCVTSQTDLFSGINVDSPDKRLDISPRIELELLANDGEDLLAHFFIGYSDSVACPEAVFQALSAQFSASSGLEPMKQSRSVEVKCLPKPCMPAPAQTYLFRSFAYVICYLSSLVRTAVDHVACLRASGNTAQSTQLVGLSDLSVLCLASRPPPVWTLRFALMSAFCIPFAHNIDMWEYG